MQMLVVADTEDPFPPLPDDHYVTLEASRAAVDHLLASLPSAFAHTTTMDTCMGAALQVRTPSPPSLSLIHISEPTRPY